MEKTVITTRSIQDGAHMWYALLTKTTFRSSLYTLILNNRSSLLSELQRRSPWALSHVSCATFFHILSARQFNRLSKLGERSSNMCKLPYHSIARNNQTSRQTKRTMYLSLVCLK
jgi:hypothetical protein